MALLDALFERNVRKTAAALPSRFLRVRSKPHTFMDATRQVWRNNPTQQPAPTAVRKSEGRVSNGYNVLRGIAAGLRSNCRYLLLIERADEWLISVAGWWFEVRALGKYSGAGAHGCLLLSSYGNKY